MRGTPLAGSHVRGPAARHFSCLPLTSGGCQPNNGHRYNGPASERWRLRGVHGPAETAVAIEVPLDALPQVGAREIRPQRVEEDELGIRRLPQQEVRRPLFTARADEQVDVRHVGLVKALLNEL